MDMRKLSTAECIDSGVLNLPVPKSGAPDTIERFRFEEGQSDDLLRQALLEGKLIESPNYYGIPEMWKTANGYRLVLFQYRSITEDHTFSDSDVGAAIAKFRELARETE